MTSAITTSSFSLTRMRMLVGYYRSEFTRQLTVYAFIVAGMFLLASIPYLKGLHFLEIFVMETLLALAPLPFSAERSRITTAMLPVKASEKYALLLIYSIVVVPLFIFAVWQLLYLCTCWTDYTYSIFDMTEIDSPSQVFAEHLNKPILYLFNIVTNLAPLCSVILVVLSARNSVIVKSLLAYIGTLMVYFIIGATIGIVVTYREIHDLAGQCAEPNAAELQDLTMPIVVTCGAMIGCISLLYLAFAFWRSYHKISRSQY